MFDRNTYINRRNKLQQKTGKGLLLFLGNNESPMNYTDNTYPFRQDSDFLYFFGLGQPGLAAIIDVDNQKTILFGDDLSVEYVVWMGPQPSMTERAQRVGVEHTAPFNALADYLAKAQAAGQDIHYLPPYRASNKILLSQLLGQSLPAIDQGASASLIRAIVSIASIKEPQEIAEMEKALVTTQKMHHAAMQNAHAGMLEAELVGLIEGLAIAGGGRLAYPAILTINGQTLHNHDHSNRLQEGQMVLCDFGAESASSYASDITRTFPVANTFTTQQKAIYQLVLDAENQAIAALKPGVPYKDIHLLAARLMAEGLKDLGLMKGDIDEAVQQGAHALFFPHGLGHMIGMDVHDMEGLGENYVGYDDTISRSTQFGLKSLRLAKALQEGFVLTVEPGLYFIPELIDQWKAEGKHASFINYDEVEKYRSFSGIRIEDNVLVTADGFRVLGPPIAKTIAEVEKLRQG
jgi:Xaa-Pro aminopeptidase